MANRKRKFLGALCVVALSLGIPAAAQAAVDPVFIYSPTSPPAMPAVPPGTGFNGPCGLAVDSAGNVYVSDYYHHTVDVFGVGSSLGYKTQLKEVDPFDGPCGLALDATGKLYVNDFHRDVVRYTPAIYPPSTNTSYTPGPTLDSEHPTGVAVDGTAVYVDDRTYVAAYDSVTGAPLLDGESHPLKIGAGSLVDGYGLAAGPGRIFVADAASKTVKAFSTITGALVLTITGPPGGFASLLDSALAVDRVNGDIYVADRRSSPFSERPESTIQVFDSTGVYKGHLKYNVIDAAPVGLAVDNSVGVNQGRVYVTSGNTSGAVVYAYTKEAATTATSLPPSSGLGAGGAGAGGAGAVVVGVAAATAAVAVAEEGQAAGVAETGATKRAANLKRRAKHRQRVHHHRHLKRRSR